LNSKDFPRHWRIGFLSPQPIENFKVGHTENYKQVTESSSNDVAAKGMCDWTPSGRLEDKGAQIPNQVTMNDWNHADFLKATFIIQ